MNQDEKRAAIDAARQRWQSGEITEAEFDAERKKIETAGTGGCALAIVLAPIVAFILLIGGCSAIVAFGPKDEAGASSAKAIQACRDAVRAQLKDPSSAKFDNESESSGRVTGTVSATNSFGGRVAHSFTCTYSGGKATATLQ